MSNPLEHYRTSHAASGYGRHYNRTYEVGYYAELWRSVERPLLEHVFAALSRAGAKRYLDFACGTGRITEVAERHFERSTGVDISAEMLSVAAERCKNTELLLRDITREPLEGEYDVVSAFRFFLNAESALRTDALQAISRLLAKNGCVLLNVHVNSRSPLGRVYELRNRLKGRVVAKTAGLEDVERSVQAAGLRVQQVLWYGCYPRTGWRLQGLAERLLAPTELYYQTASWIPRHWAQSFIAICAREGERAPLVQPPRARRSETGELVWEC